MTLSSLWLAMALVPVAQDGASGSARVAVVNVAVVSEKYARTADLEARFEDERRRLQQERDTLHGKIERTTRSLQEELKPGTEAFEARRKELAMLQAELQWFIEFEGRRVEQGLANSLRSIFSDIQGAVREVAEEKGIDIVLAYDRLSEESPETPMRARQEIALQKVVYWSPRVDLTAEVIQRLNAKYEARGSASPEGSAEPVRSQDALGERTEQAKPISIDGS